MATSLLYRIFGAGKIPTARRAALEAEGIVILEEGLGGRVSYRRYRAPGKRYGRRTEGIVGSVALTSKRLVAFRWSKPIIDVPFDHPAFKKLSCKVENEDTLRLSFEAEDFHDDRSGTINCRYSTDRANTFQRKLWQLSR